MVQKGFAEFKGLGNSIAKDAKEAARLLNKVAKDIKF